MWTPYSPSTAGSPPKPSRKRFSQKPTSPPLLAFDAPPESWIDYQNRILDSVESYEEANPGPEAATFREEEARWRLDHERDQEFMAWTVWIGETQP